MFQASSKMERQLEVNSFWALNDISFKVNAGEIVGIIGRNGSGKSTLLKIMSRITNPTKGTAEINGHLSSLLEVGTGFHPELSGRENIFLNGALLGMTRKEIVQRFDEIVSFSEIGKFIDTPVKFYSSGMYVRLAFSVAAHLDPDILVVDEVLAVGDGGFQRKCIGRMGAEARKNRTILFVSHSMMAIRALCNRVIVLDQGRIVMDGNTDDGISAYTRLISETGDLSTRNSVDRMARSNGHVRFVDIKIGDPFGKERSKFTEGETVVVTLKFHVYETVPSLGLMMGIRSSLSGEFLTTIKKIISTIPLAPTQKETMIKIELPNILLRPGDYGLYIWLGDQECEDSWDVLDENVNLPWLTIVACELDRDKLHGYFSIPSKVDTSPA